MNIAYASAVAIVRLMVLAAGLAHFTALADEYGEVSRMISAGRLAEAQARAERHLTNKPRDPQMRYLLGSIQRQSGQPEQALLTFTRLSEEFPELPEPHNARAVILAASGDLDQARAALEQALQVHPGYAAAHENMGDVLARLAARAYCRARALEPGNAGLDAKLAALSGACP